MPDLTLCSNGATYPQAKICQRYTATPDANYQSYANFFTGNYCDYFLPDTSFLA